MRITFTTVNRNVQRNLSRRYADMAGLQEQLATGKRLRKPSDDPIDVANTIKLRAKETQLTQFKRNIEDGLAVMGVASSAMSSMNELIHRARELAVQGANGTYTDSDRHYMQQEVDQLYRQMMSVINTQFKGQYIFNGTNTNVPPYILASSDSERMDYVNRTMATYGEEMELALQTGDMHDQTDTIYLDFTRNSMKVGDTLQLKWNSVDPDVDGRALQYIYEETFNLDTISVAGSTHTFEKGRDYEIDYTTGKVHILTEDFGDALNRVDPGDRKTATAIDSTVYNNPAAQPSGTATQVIQYSLDNTFQIVGGKFGDAIDNIFPGSMKIRIGNKEYLEGHGEYMPGYYDEEGVYQKGKNQYDYSVDYETGKITIYNMELLRDMRPDWLIDPSTSMSPNSAESMYNAGKFQINFDYITHGTDIYGDKVASQGDIYRAIEEGITVPINMLASDMLRDAKSGTEMVGVFLRYSQALLKDDREGIQKALDELSYMYDAVLNAQSEMGAKIYRFELTQSRNAEQNVEVSGQRSALEDADLAEVISRLLLAENVYNAALQSAMRVIQPSLANYM